VSELTCGSADNDESTETRAPPVASVRFSMTRTTISSSARVTVPPRAGQRDTTTRVSLPAASSRRASTRPDDIHVLQT